MGGDSPSRKRNRLDRGLWCLLSNKAVVLQKGCNCCSTCCCRVMDKCKSADNNNITSPLPSSSSLGDEAIVVMNMGPDLIRELWISTDLLFQSRLMWLLALGLVALVGDATGTLGEAACFCLSGIALIPCAERLSFVTEQVASRTNGTIGALLNATFGNAPELLISTAALRAGYYRVVQLAMLGSMLTNLLFVFGLSCLVGGLRWQVQELRIPSGGVSVAMLLMATAGSLLPAALEMSGQFQRQPKDEDIPTREELQFCRVNAAVMIIMYMAYLLFQLGTHKEEFDDEEGSVSVSHHATRTHLIIDDDDEDRGAEMQQFPRRGSGSARPNLFCMHYFWCCPSTSGLAATPTVSTSASCEDVEMAGAQPVELKPRVDSDISSYHHDRPLRRSDDGARDEAAIKSSHDPEAILMSNTKVVNDEMVTTMNDSKTPTKSPHLRRKKNPSEELTPLNENFPLSSLSRLSKMNRSNRNLLRDLPVLHDSNDEGEMEQRPERVYLVNAETEVTMSLWAGIVWLFALTICISALSDILVDTIDGFARRMHLSEVFTSMVILPFFSNVAEQVSAVLFAYRNEMDLCVGVTVGSAIQIATFVLPGCVLIGAVFNRSMTLFFHGYETVCLLLGVICVASILQGGTTNWLVGMFLMGIYIMIATGIWFHESENLTIDAEILIHNSTAT